MKKFIYSAYNIAQLERMQSAINGFIGGASELAGLINTLDGLLNALENPPKEWVDRFQSEWGGLEEISADIIYHNRKTLDKKEQEDVALILRRLESIINNAFLNS